MRRIDDQTSQPGRRADEAVRGSLRLAPGVASGPRPESRSGDTPSRPARATPDREAHRAWEVAAENRAAASSISAFDARWVLAVRAADAIEGGRAAIIRPEVRRRLVTTARGLGLRPFDTNLVLAIVQDAARQGRNPRDVETINRLMLVAEPRRADRPPARVWAGLLLFCSAVWAAALVWWLLA